MKLINSRLRARALGTTALVALGGLMLGANPADAACTSSAPLAGETVTCSGAVVDPVITGAAGVTVNLDPTADFNINDIYAIRLGNDGTVTLNGNAGSSARIYAIENDVVGIEGDDGLTVTLNADSQISIYGNDGALGIDGGSGSSVVLNGTSGLNVVGMSDYGVGIALEGPDSTVTLNGQSFVRTYSHDISIGIAVNGGGNTVTLNDSAYARGTSFYSLTDGMALGVAASGDGDTITLNGDSMVAARTIGDVADYAAGIFSIGADTVITLNGASEVRADIDNSFVYATGGMLVGGSGERTVTLNGASRVAVDFYDSTGYLALGIGFGNVAYPGGGGTLTLNGASRVDVDIEASNLYIAGGVVANSNDANIVLNNTSAIGVYLDDSSVFAATGLWAFGDDNMLTLNGASGVSLALYGSQSVIAAAAGLGDLLGVGPGFGGTGGTLTLNGTAQIGLEIDASDATAAFAALAFTDDATIVLNGASAATTYITDSTVEYAGGIYALGDGNTIVLNDFASVDVTVMPSADVTDFLSGIGVRGDGNDIVMNGASSVTLNGVSNAYAAAGVLLFGTGNTLTLNGNATVDVTPSVYAHGVYIYGGDGNTVVLNGSASVLGGSGSGIHAYDATGVTIALGRDASVSGAVGIHLDDTDDSNIRVAGAVAGTFAGIVIDGDNNTLTLDTGAAVAGGIYANGDNALELQGAGELDTLVAGFGNLAVNATGAWNLSNTLVLDDTFGPGAATLNSGATLVNGLLIAPGGVAVGAGATLGGNGVVVGDVVNFGTLSPGNSPGVLFVFGDFDFAAGSAFLLEADATGADLLIATNDVNIDPASTLHISHLAGVDGFDATIVIAGNAVNGTFGSVTGGAGALTYTPTTVSLLAMRPTSINGALVAGAQAGFAFLDALNGQARHGIGGAGRIWTTGIGEDGRRKSDGIGGAFDSKTYGGVFGGDVYSTGAASFGIAAGYLDTVAKTAGGGSSVGIEAWHLGAYGSWGVGNGFVTGAIGGAFQTQDAYRAVLAGGGLATATASPDAWSAGAGLVAGHAFPLEGNWMLTPTAHIAYQRLERDGYSETGGGTAAIRVGGQTAETLKAGIGAELGVEIGDPNARWSVRPVLRAGIGREMQLGDTTVGGAFLSTGAPFTATLDSRDQTVLTGGAGVDVAVGNGISGFLSWNGSNGEAGSTGAFTLGARLTW
ncbi:MAG: autotransporter domain-containing protein [Parvibaculum sp.]|nr:autotransporter domain-containing protein [Parvibaculum sp.]